MTDKELIERMFNTIYLTFGQQPKTAEEKDVEITGTDKVGVNTLLIETKKDGRFIIEISRPLQCSCWACSSSRR